MKSDLEMPPGWRVPACSPGRVSFAAMTGPFFTSQGHCSEPVIIESCCKIKRMPLHLTPALQFFPDKTRWLILLLAFLPFCVPAQDAVFLKNRWSNEYLCSNNSQVVMLPAAKKQLWFIERADDDFVRLKNKEGLYLNVEKGFLEAGTVQPGFFSAQWKLPVTDGFNSIINRWTSVQIHNQNGKPEASKAQPGWWSAQWAMENQQGEALAAKDFSLNAYAAFKPAPNSYYKFEQLHYLGDPVFLDIDKYRSTELVIKNEYGGDNSGKAWTFTPTDNGWYKISNLRLGGNKVLAVAKNTDGSYYYVLTDFANYPNQQWRLIEFTDPVLLKGVKENKVNPEKFNTKYYTLISRQHGLDPISIVADPLANPRFYAYSFSFALGTSNPFNLLWCINPVTDLALIKNIPLNAAETEALVSETVNKALKQGEEAILKATPIPVSPFKYPEGHIIGEEQLTPAVSGRNLSGLLSSSQAYTLEEWTALIERAGKIPMAVYNNTNGNLVANITYTDQQGQYINRNTLVPATKNHCYYLDPLCTYIVIKILDPDTREPYYDSGKFFRPKAIKMNLDGTGPALKASTWNY